MLLRRLAPLRRPATPHSSPDKIPGAPRFKYFNKISTTINYFVRDGQFKITNGSFAGRFRRVKRRSRLFDDARREHLQKRIGPFTLGFLEPSVERGADVRHENRVVGTEHGLRVFLGQMGFDLGCNLQNFSIDCKIIKK